MSVVELGQPTRSAASPDRATELTALHAHRLINYVAGLRVAVETLGDTELCLSPVTRTELRDDALETAQHLASELSRLVYGMPAELLSAWQELAS